MKLFDLIKNIEVKETNINITEEKNNFEICNITRNSLDVKVNAAFICLAGTKTDGHKYIGEAVKNGAVLVILEYKPEDFEEVIIKSNTPYVIVQNTRKTEAELWMTWYGDPIKSKSKFKSGKIKIIGITGTNGKTSVSYMIKQILEDAGYKTALFGTIKYIIGDLEKESKLTTCDPDEIARLFSVAGNAGIDYVVMEISSHSLELDKIAGLGIIDIGIFTNLTQDHLDFHGSMENYKRAKAKLFRMCKTGILNADDEATRDIIDLSASKNYLYGIKSRADFQADNIKYLGVNGIEYDFAAINTDKIFKISSPMAGGFYVYNTLAAATAGYILGIDGEIISGALKKVKIRGRMEKLDTNTPYSIFIDYAHTPDALENVLKSIRIFTEGRIIALFGCGGDRDKIKRPIMGRIASKNSDFCIITSDNSRTEEPVNIIEDIVRGISGDKFTKIIDRREAIEYAMDIAQPGDVILLAGKGHEDYINEKGQIKHFSEREIVYEFEHEHRRNS
ncbi:MAG: UDP-N-acetylmuramoyl-L-alanyl-D-glutamate--2,6-diaminopimelate ligase [Oscillospiraceae bacterium]|nr:UDP-N-acetylmuramoyl-L-alanyl-D-glutamate--2,6-diaminopimelate ligase [Oscillospiraceae bacterium]